MKAWDVAAPGRVSRRALFDEAESFQELVEVNVPILVEIDAANQVINAIIREFNVHVGAEQLPGLLEFLKGDETCGGAFYMLQLHLLMWRTLAKTTQSSKEALYKQTFQKLGREEEDLSLNENTSIPTKESSKAEGNTRQ